MGNGQLKPHRQVESIYRWTLSEQQLRPRLSIYAYSPPIGPQGLDGTDGGLYASDEIPAFRQRGG